MASPIDCPFRVWLREGDGSWAKRIPLHEYCREENGVHTSAAPVPSSWQEAPVKLTENLPLHLELESSAGEDEIVILWDDLSESDSEEAGHERIIRLTADNRSHVLAKPNEGYPWRCGLYGFRVQYRGRSWAGYYEIVPRNFSGGQLRHVHDTINRHLNGLVTDYRMFKKAVTHEAGLESVAYWQFFAWYKTKERQLLQAVSAIVRYHDMELRESYAVEQVSRRQTAKSIRWDSSAQGMRHGNNRYLNRRMELHADSSANRLVKVWLRGILGHMQTAICSLRELNRSYQSEHERLSEELHRQQDYWERLNQNKVVSRKDRDNNAGALQLKKASVEKVTARLVALHKLEREFTDYQNTLRQILHDGFWRQVQDKPVSAGAFGQHAAYRQVYEIWARSCEWAGGPRKDERGRTVPVPKSTAVLYEYYALFAAVEAFRGLGYAPYQDTVSEQLEKTFYSGGLTEGTRISLVKGRTLVVLTYDQLLETHDNQAAEHGTNFYSSEAKRKPDIRIDQYDLEGDDMEFRSAFIIEVKYRPFWNIYSVDGHTDTMLQMSKYFSIKYVREAQGERRYKRNPVHDVVCVYPGDPKQPPILETGSGYFLQLYPDEHGAIAGLELLMMRLNAWLSG